MTLYDAQGKYVALLASDIGKWSGSQAQGIENDGIYVLAVEGDGAWSVAVS